MNVHFFRHGAAISNDPRLTEAEIAEERFLDAPPSDHGREQARLAQLGSGKELAHALHAATVDVVLVSPLCRALETAELILSSAGISPRRQCE
jgi:broad specificity phosphatase PhoE